MTTPVDTTNDFLTDGQLCELLHVTSRTTMRWRRDGNGPAFIRCGGRRVLYCRTDVLAWLASRTYPHRAAETVAA